MSYVCVAVVVVASVTRSSLCWTHYIHVRCRFFVFKLLCRISSWDIVGGSRWTYIEVYGSLVEAGRSFHPAWPWKLPRCFHFGNFPLACTRIKLPCTSMEFPSYFQSITNYSTTSILLRSDSLNFGKSSGSFSTHLPKNEELRNCTYEYYVHTPGTWYHPGREDKPIWCSYSVGKVFGGALCAYYLHV